MTWKLKILICCKWRLLHVSTRTYGTHTLKWTRHIYIPSIFKQRKRVSWVLYISELFCFGCYISDMDYCSIKVFYHSCLCVCFMVASHHHSDPLPHYIAVFRGGGDASGGGAQKARWTFMIRGGMIDWDDDDKKESRNTVIMDVSIMTMFPIAKSKQCVKEGMNLETAWICCSSLGLSRVSAHHFDWFTLIPLIALLWTTAGICSDLVGTKLHTVQQRRAKQGW